MSMKSLIFLVLFVATSIAAEDSSAQKTSFVLLSPQGFRFSIENKPGILESSFSLQIYKQVDGKDSDEASEEYAGDLTLQTNNWWTYQSLNSTLSPGDKVIFAVANVINESTGNDLDALVIDMYEVPSDAARIAA